MEFPQDLTQINAKKENSPENVFVTESVLPWQKI
jgi:hypothetical protein